MKHSQILKGYFFVIASALIFGCMPLGAKFIYAEGVNSLSLVFLRNCLAIPILAFLAKSQGHSLRIRRDALLEISLIAIMGCCITPVLLFASYNYLASGTATIFHFYLPCYGHFRGCIGILGNLINLHRFWFFTCGFGECFNCCI